MLYIVTLAELKAQAGIDDTAEDAGLTLWLEGLQGRLDGFLKRTLLRGEDHADYFDGGRSSLYLSRYPTESVASVIVDQDKEWPADDALTLNSDFYLDAEFGRLSYAAGRWPQGFGHVRVVSTGGYVATGVAVGDGQLAMPDAIRRAMLMQGNFEWRNRDMLGLTTVTASGATVSAVAGVLLSLKSKTLLPEVEETLSPYRRWI